MSNLRAFFQFQNYFITEGGDPGPNITEGFAAGVALITVVPDGSPWITDPALSPVAIGARPWMVISPAPGVTFIFPPILIIGAMPATVISPDGGLTTWLLETRTIGAIPVIFILPAPGLAFWSFPIRTVGASPKIIISPDPGVTFL